MQRGDRGWRKIFNSRVFLFATVALAIFMIFAYVKTYYQDYLVRQEIVRLQESAKQLQTRKLELLQALDYVKSRAFVEEKARAELGMAKPGEHVLVIPTDTQKGYRQEPAAVIKSNSESNYYKWWRLFAGAKQ